MRLMDLPHFCQRLEMKNSTNIIDRVRLHEVRHGSREVLVGNRAAAAENQLKRALCHPSIASKPLIKRRQPSTPHTFCLGFPSAGMPAFSDRWTIWPDVFDICRLISL